MEIFVDEAGQFTPHSGWSAVGCLSVPHKEIGPARRRLTYLARDWPRAANGEVKGGSLNAGQLGQLVELLHHHAALLNVAAIDVARETHNGLLKHKASQAELITKLLMPDHPEHVRASALKLRYGLERMPMQLYVQSVVMRHLVAATMQDVTFYFSQRRPRELGEFKWTVDAKDPLRVTSQEEWWRDTLGPLIETASRRQPLIMLKDEKADYRYFDHAYALTKEMPTDNGGIEIANGYDIGRAVAEKIAFVDSRADIMVQAIDVLINFFRRFLTGQTTDLAIARNLGSLQISKRDASGRSYCANFVTLSNAEGRAPNAAWRDMMTAMTKASRTALAPDRSRARAGTREKSAPKGQPRGD